MSRKEVLKNLQERFKDDIIEVFERTPERVYIEIKPGSLVEIVTYVFKDLGARFNTASGVDCRQHIEILYHFTFEDMNFIISFRVKLELSGLEIDSLVPVFEGANWIEREMNEMLGINFKGHPNLRRLLLPDDWPEGKYPLRVDYKEWDKNAIRDRGV